MLENILIYTIGFLSLMLLFLWIYFECFLIRKLYHEICVAKKNIKISMWHGYRKRLKCLKGFNSVEPYSKRVKRALSWDKKLTWLSVLLLLLVVVYKLLGYGNRPKPCLHKEENISITVTKIEGNKSNIKSYDAKKNQNQGHQNQGQLPP